jgi:dUTP pyrophosphatase
LLCPYDTAVPANGKELIRTDLQIELTEGYYDTIAPKTDLALFHHRSNGRVTDKDVGGNLSVLLYNHSENPYNISRGDKIAKLIR